MEFREKAYDIFEMFDKSFALVTAGSPDKFNSCTISWGSFGNIWGAPGKSKATITVYVPAISTEIIMWSILRKINVFF